MYGQNLRSSGDPRLVVGPSVACAPPKLAAVIVCAQDGHFELLEVSQRSFLWSLIASAVRTARPPLTPPLMPPQQLTTTTRSFLDVNWSSEPLLSVRSLAMFARLVALRVFLGSTNYR